MGCIGHRIQVVRRIVFIFEEIFCYWGRIWIKGNSQHKLALWVFQISEVGSNYHATSTFETIISKFVYFGSIAFEISLYRYLKFRISKIQNNVFFFSEIVYSWKIENRKWCEEGTGIFWLCMSEANTFKSQEQKIGGKLRDSKNSCIILVIYDNIHALVILWPKAA